MRTPNLAAILLATISVCVLIACNGVGGSDVRTLTVVARDDRCAPTAFVVEPGRYVQLRLENEGRSAFTLRDRDGRLEAVASKLGEAAEAFYLIPEGVGKYGLLCASERGVETEISITATTGVTANGIASPPPSTVAVSLADFTITPSNKTVSSGQLTFITTNASSGSVHELNVLELQRDGSLLNVAAIAPILPNAGGVVTVKLRRGTYRLACQITIGEAGSTVDHYQQSMWVDITLE